MKRINWTLLVFCLGFALYAVGLFVLASHGVLPAPTRGMR
jgi:hypothetical protein